jgi:Rieske Fe-S protein
MPLPLETVIDRALARDPAQRFQSGAELASAFARALSTGSHTVMAPTLAQQQKLVLPAQKSATGGNWQLRPPVVTGQLPSVQPAPDVTTQPTQAIPPAAPVQAGSYPLPSSPLLSAKDVDELAIDPFEWWSKTFTGHLPASSAPVTGAPGAAGTYGPAPARRPAARRQQMKRRQVVAALAAGGLLVAGFGGLSLAHMLENNAHQPAASTTGTMPGTKTTPTQGQVAGNTTATPATSQPTAKPTTKPTQKPTATPTHGPTATPTSAPSPTPTRSVPTPTPTPSHTGTVIGHTSQPTNTATSFSNPSDGHGSLLIHLPNGNFVAYEKACTHAGVPVYYDGGSHQLVCPAHGARFDPANGAQVLQGPANRPLPGVTIHVNADGTITA